MSAEDAMYVLFIWYILPVKQRDSTMEGLRSHVQYNLTPEARD